MANGKNFNLYLMDGDVTGRIKCTLSNWTGLAFKIPRNDLSACKEREDLKQSGVYFLFGEDQKQANRSAVYIGQAGIRKNGEGLLLRAVEHRKDAFDFQEAVMLTTQNNSFGPTEISYLENRFTNLAKDVDRYTVINGNDPNPGHVTEEKESELEEFIEYSKMVLGVLGYRLFVPLDQPGKMPPSGAEETDSNRYATVFHLRRKIKKTGRIVQGIGKRSNEGFVVLKGSKIETSDARVVSQNVKDLKTDCIKNGDLVDGILQKDLIFSSPSTAAMFVIGNSANGRVEWRTEAGQTLNAVEEAELSLDDESTVTTPSATKTSFAGPI